MPPGRSEGSKTLLESVISDGRLALRYWPLILGLALTFSGAWIYIKENEPDIYSSDGRMSFKISSSMSGLASLAQSIVGGSSSEGNLSQLKEIVLSRSVFQQLLNSKMVSPTGDSLMVRKLLLDYAVDNNETFNDWYITHGQNVSDEWMDLKLHDYYTLEDGEVVTADLGEESGLLHLQVSSSDSLITWLLAYGLTEETRNWYDGMEKDSYTRTYNVIKAKSDSIADRISSLTAQRASYQDRQRGVLQNRYRLSLEAVEQELMMLSVAYTQAIENREIAHFSLLNQDSRLMILETPVFPYDPDDRGVFKMAIAILVGVTIACFFGIMIMINLKYLVKLRR